MASCDGTVSGTDKQGTVKTEAIVGSGGDFRVGVEKVDSVVGSLRKVTGKVVTQEVALLQPADSSTLLRCGAASRPIRVHSCWERLSIERFPGFAG